MQLQNKVALITGAASGFGAELARKFAAEGAKLSLFDLDADGLAKVAAEVGGEAVCSAGNVAEEADVQAAVDATLAAHGKLDILMNNAGIGGRMRPIARMDPADFDTMMAVNVRGVFLCARAAIPHIADAGGGSIINTSSTAAFKPRPGTAAYTMAKAGVAAFTRALAVEVGPQNIRVNALLPVAADTAFLDKQFGDKKEAALPGIAEAIPLRRLCQVGDYANAAAFLCSDQASFLNGVLLNVDGGWLSF